MHIQKQAHTDDKTAVWKTPLSSFCFTFRRANRDTNKPIISVSTTTASSWSEFTFIQMWFLWLCNLFSSAWRNSHERNHNGFTCPWEKEYIQTLKKIWFSLTLQLCRRPLGDTDGKWLWLLPAWADFEGRLRGTMSWQSNVPVLSPGSL